MCGNRKTYIYKPSPIWCLDSRHQMIIPYTHIVWSTPGWEKCCQTAGSGSRHGSGCILRSPQKDTTAQKETSSVGSHRMEYFSIWVLLRTIYPQMWFLMISISIPPPSFERYWYFRKYKLRNCANPLLEPEVYAKNPVILYVSKLNGEKQKLRIWSGMTFSGSVGCGLPSNTQYPWWTLR